MWFRVSYVPVAVAPGVVAVGNLAAGAALIGGGDGAAGVSVPVANHLVGTGPFTAVVAADAIALEAA